MAGPGDQAQRGVVAGNAEAALLEMTGIRKTFGPVVALDGVDFAVAPREVHGLLGGNGAGKTTLMNVLYGLYRADSGVVRLEGRDVTIRSPRDAIALGVGMVHQNFLQVETYTVTENIVLGTDQPSLPALDLHRSEQHIAELSDRFGLVVHPRALVADLPVGLRQRVEILKALYRNARLLVLDEPTTNLTPQEVDALFSSLRAIVEEGMSVVFITHKIRETMSVCDVLTVMRDGRRITSLPRRSTTAHELAALMVGDERTVPQVAEALGEAPLDQPADAIAASPAPEDAVSVLTVESVTVHNDHGIPAVHDVTFTVRAGEVLGIAGVAGNGQSELAEGVAGVRPLQSGSVRLGQDEMTGRPTAAWLNAGIAYVPEDRHRDGVLPTGTVVDNLVLGSQRSRRFRRGRFLDWGRAREHAVEAMRDYSVKAAGPTALVGNLSGGNMQRIVLARAFTRQPRLLVLHNPTRGLDIRSTKFVHDRIRSAAADGCAVLLVSEDLDELSVLADRLVVLYGGRLSGERRKGEYDPYELGRLMAGVDDTR
jgi:general nucleoside transport system ATP-binding protein